MLQTIRLFDKDLLCFGRQAVRTIGSGIICPQLMGSQAFPSLPIEPLLPRDDYLAHAKFCRDHVAKNLGIPHHVFTEPTAPADELDTVLEGWDQASLDTELDDESL